MELDCELIHLAPGGATVKLPPTLHSMAEGDGDEDDNEAVWRDMSRTMRRRKKQVTLRASPHSHSTNRTDDVPLKKFVYSPRYTGAKRTASTRTTGGTASPVARQRVGSVSASASASANER